MRALKIFIVVFLLGLLITSNESFGAGASDMTQSVSGGGVTVKATYLNRGKNEDPRFQLVLDTHSVGLDGYDLQKITVLREDSGKIYSPKAAENKGSGHHREIVLSFPKFSSEAKRVELVIKDIAGVKERTFRWVLP